MEEFFSLQVTLLDLGEDSLVSEEGYHERKREACRDVFMDLPYTLVERLRVVVVALETGEISQTIKDLSNKRMVGFLLVFQA